jgi:hypothetical protein
MAATLSVSIIVGEESTHLAAAMENLRDDSAEVRLGSRFPSQ